MHGIRDWKKDCADAGLRANVREIRESECTAEAARREGHLKVHGCDCYWYLGDTSGSDSGIVLR